MRIFLKLVLLVALALIIALAALWVTLAVWYRLPASETIKFIVCGALLLFGCVVVISASTRYRWRAIGIFAMVFAATLIWWSTIKPEASADWSADVARQVTGKVNGDFLTLKDVRNFDWRSDDDYRERWETRTYDLRKLSSIDMFLSYWAGPEMAHVIISFGFEGNIHLAWSIEVRRKRGGEFSPIAGLFKSDPLVIIAADERDVVGVRSNVRGEDVQLYRLRTPPEEALPLLLEYVRQANSLSIKPEFYNSLTSNCTTDIVKIMRAVGDKISFDWRLIVNGYLPEYVYERGALNNKVPLAELKALAHIDKRASAVGLTSDYSQHIRIGVPSPLN